MSSEPLLEHGGALRRAARQYDIPLANWLDLSTGINPHGWPVPSLPAQCWQRLPEPDDGLEEAARQYYRSEYLLPVAGSQAAIQALPQLRAPCRVGLWQPSYAEHAAAWQGAGHDCMPLQSVDAINAALSALDVLLLVNPNNPDGQRFSTVQLQHWHAELAARGGWLIIDEAFADPEPQHSLAADTGQPGLIVLRSLGKFFGLAGLRVGFVLAWPVLLYALQARLGPWTVSGPAREVACLALSDRPWQQQMRIELPQQAQRLAELLGRHGLAPQGGTALFQYCPTPQAATIHQALARQGILLRLFDETPALRLGLPATAQQWQRLEQGLAGGMSKE